MKLTRDILIWCTDGILNQMDTQLSFSISLLYHSWFLLRLIWHTWPATGRTCEMSVLVCRDTQHLPSALSLEKLKYFSNASFIFIQNIEVYCCGKYSWHSFNVTFALCPWRILTVSLYFRSPINVSGADRKGLFPLLSALTLRCWDWSEMGDMNSHSDGIANTDHNITTLFVSTEQT